MRRIAATFSLVLILLVTLLIGAAAADPRNKPTYTLQCGSTTYTVVSPDVAVTGSDVNSTSQLGAHRWEPPLITRRGIASARTGAVTWGLWGTQQGRSTSSG